jgi:hypothetical protein
MLLYSSKASWVQCLHQQCANATNQCGNVTMDNPWRIMWKVEPSSFPGLNGFHPRRNAIFGICDDSTKSSAKAFL